MIQRKAHLASLELEDAVKCKDSELETLQSELAQVKQKAVLDLLRDGQLQLKNRLLQFTIRPRCRWKRLQATSTTYNPEEEDLCVKDDAPPQPEPAREFSMGLVQRRVRSKGPAPKPGAVGRASIQACLSHSDAEVPQRQLLAFQATWSSWLPSDDGWALVNLASL